MKLTVKKEQSVFDIALIAYGDASMAYKLIAGNPQISDLTADITGMELTFDQVKTSNPKEAQQVPATIKKEVIVSSTQTLFDLALQYTGNAENVFDLIKANPQLENILSDPTGIALNFTLDPTYIPEYFRASTINISTKTLTATSSEGSFILTEAGFHLLQENGFYLHLQ